MARVCPAFELAGGQHGSHLAAQRGSPTLTAYVIVEGERLGASSSILIFLTGGWWVQKQQRKWMSAAGRWKAGRWDQAASDLSDGRTVRSIILNKTKKQAHIPCLARQTYGRPLWSNDRRIILIFVKNQVIMCTPNSST